MRTSVDCKHCFGCGRVHSPLRNGDPDDEGLTCEACDGAGVVDIELEDFCDDD